MHPYAVLLAILVSGCAAQGEAFDPLEPDVPRSPLEPKDPDDVDSAPASRSDIDLEVEAVGAASNVVSQPARPSLGSFNLCGNACAIDPRWTEGGKKLPPED